jgi:hypothetical protein
MNNDKLNLQHPDTITNNDNSFSSVTETPVLNPNPIRTEDTTVHISITSSNVGHEPPPINDLCEKKNINLNIEIPHWSSFTDTNNEIPTMDYSPMYATDSPEIRSRKNYTQRNPICFGKHNGTNHTIHNTSPFTHNIDEPFVDENRSFLIRCCEFIFSYCN